MNLTLNFKELNKNNAMIAGGKGASLGEMTQAGIPVPPGFVVLSTTFDEFIKEADLVQEIDAAINEVNHKEIHAVENASEKIQALIKNAVMPKRIADEIKNQFKELNTEYVAVRSSATAEDGADNAWAGQLDSYLNTKEDDLLEKVQHCWASLFTPRAIFYRFEKGLHTTKISVAVVVQKMINSEVSGIAFSVHPVTEDRNQMIIEAGFGLGEAIVSGSITPDSYVVEKEPRIIIDINVSTQSRGLYRLETGGNEWVDIPEPKASSQVLTEPQILELADHIITIENHYGFPCDIEWAYENNKFYIVQSRPITTLQDEVKKYDEIENQTTENKSIKFEEYVIPRERELDLNPAYWNTVLHTSKDVEKIYGITLPVEYNFYASGQLKMAVPKTVWNKTSEFIVEKLVNEKGYFENIEEKTEIAKQNIISFLENIKKTDITELSFQDLIKNSNKIYSLFMEYDAASVFAWLVAGDSFKKLVGENLKLNTDELDILALPEEQTFTTQMERSVLEIALKSEVTKREINSLVDKYYWIPFGYDGPNIWDSKHFESRIEQCKKNIEETKTKYDEIINRDVDLKQKSKEIIKNRNFNKEEKKLIHVLRSNAIWTDERKMLEFQLFHTYNQILLELGEKTDFSIKHLKYLFTHELSKLEEDSIKLKEIAEQRITKEFMTISENGIIRIATELEKKKVEEIIEKQSQKIDIVGNVACRGTDKKYIAVVKILRSSKECSKVLKGEILVATMTTPDYVPAMDRALGFITDEGGVTCHAAIIAREMNKPCVIGTKNATQILKDGDLVEVDVNNGVVRIIK